MENTFGRSGALAALTLVLAATAFAAPPAPTTTAPRIDLAAAQTSRTQVQAQISHASAQSKQSGVIGATAGGVKPAEVFANPDRAYPPSCLNSPMPLNMWQNDPNALQAQINLVGDPFASSSAERNYIEPVTVTLFRVACADGYSATLLEIARPSAKEGNFTLYPTFPAISVAQGSNNVYIRLPDDPNTFFSTTYSLTPVVNSDVYVLENFYGGAQQFNYNQAFTLSVDNLNSVDPKRFTSFPLAAYNAAQYPEASQPLPISGYMSTTWTNPNQDGEGFFLQVYDDRNTTSRTLAFGWFTYDDLGLPFWLYGQVDNFAIGTNTVVVDTSYYSGGVFVPPYTGGGPQPPAQGTYWGTVTLSFPDCNHMNVAYNGDASATQGPTGSGNVVFYRVANVNGLMCGMPQ